MSKQGRDGQWTGGQVTWKHQRSGPASCFLDRNQLAWTLWMDVLRRRTIRDLSPATEEDRLIRMRTFLRAFIEARASRKVGMLIILLVTLGVKASSILYLVRNWFRQIQGNGMSSGRRKWIRAPPSNSTSMSLYHLSVGSR